MNRSLRFKKDTTPPNEILNTAFPFMSTGLQISAAALDIHTEASPLIYLLNILPSTKPKSIWNKYTNKGTMKLFKLFFSFILALGLVL